MNKFIKYVKRMMKPVDLVNNFENRLVFRNFANAPKGTFSKVDDEIKDVDNDWNDQIKKIDNSAIESEKQFSSSNGELKKKRLSKKIDGKLLKGVESNNEMTFDFSNFSPEELKGAVRSGFIRIGDEIESLSLFSSENIESFIFSLVDKGISIPKSSMLKFLVLNVKLSFDGKMNALKLFNDDIDNTLNLNKSNAAEWYTAFVAVHGKNAYSKFLDFYSDSFELMTIEAVKELADLGFFEKDIVSNDILDKIDKTSLLGVLKSGKFSKSVKKFILKKHPEIAELNKYLGSYETAIAFNEAGIDISKGKVRFSVLGNEKRSFVFTKKFKVELAGVKTANEVKRVVYTHLLKIIGVIDSDGIIDKDEIAKMKDRYGIKGFAKSNIAMVEFLEGDTLVNASGELIEDVGIDEYKEIPDDEFHEYTEKLFDDVAKRLKGEDFNISSKSISLGKNLDAKFKFGYNDFIDSGEVKITSTNSILNVAITWPSSGKNVVRQIGVNGADFNVISNQITNILREVDNDYKFVSENLDSNGGFNGLSKNYDVSDTVEKLADGDKEKFFEKFDQLANRDLYLQVFGEYFGISAEKVPLKMFALITEYSNDDIDFTDFVNTILGKKYEKLFYSRIWDGHEVGFVDKFNFAKSRVISLTSKNPLTTKEQKELTNLKNDLLKIKKIYFGFKKVVMLLSKDVLREPNFKVTDYEGLNLNDDYEKGVRNFENIFIEDYKKISDGASEQSSYIIAETGKFKQVDGYENMSPRGMVARLLLLSERTIKVDGKDETLKIYEIKNGRREINNENFARYLNYLIEVAGYMPKASKNVKVLDVKNFDLKSVKLNSAQLKAIKSGFNIEYSKEFKKQNDRLKNLNESKEASNTVVGKRAKEIWNSFSDEQKKLISSKDVETAIGVLGAHLRDGKLKGVGYGVRVPLGDSGFSLNLGVGVDRVDTAFSVGLSYQIVKTKSFTAEVGVNVSTGGLPVVSFGYVGWSPKVTDKDRVMLGIAPLFIGVVPAAAVGVGWSEDRESAVKLASDKELSKYGLRDVEGAKTDAEKIKLLKKSDAFKELKGKVDDADYLALYESFKKQNVIDRRKETDSGWFGSGVSIVGAGAGVLVIPGLPFPIPFIGIKFQIGSEIFVSPQIGERERIAKILSENKIKGDLNVSLTEVTSKPMEFDSGRVFVDADGRIGVRDDNENILVLPTSNKEQMKKAFEKINIDFSVSNDALPGVDKDVVSLKINDIQGKDLDVYVDPDSDIDVLYDYRGDLMIPGNMDGVIVTRETFVYPYPRSKGGSVVRDVIVITKNPNFSRDSIVDRSATVLRRTSLDGKTTGLSEYKGRGYGRTDSNISYWNKYANEKFVRNESGQYDKVRNDIKYTAESYNETVLGVDKEKLKYGISDAASFREKYGANEKTENDIVKMKSRFEGAEGMKKFKEFYKSFKLKSKLNANKPMVTDLPALVDIAKEEFGNNLNIKESRQFVSLVQHEYFSNLWKKQTPSKLIKAFERHNATIGKRLLRKHFVRGIKRMGIAVGRERSFAKELIKIVNNKALDQFKEQLKDWPDGVNFSKLPSDYEFYSGTTVNRASGRKHGNYEGVFSGGPTGMFDNSGLEGVENMGIIGKPMEWDLNNENEALIAKLLLEAASPVENVTRMSDVEPFLNSSFSMKLMGFEGTSLYLGHKNYEILTKILEDINAGSDVKGVLKGDAMDVFKKYLAFAKRIRRIQINGGTFRISKNMAIKATAKVATASYGRCGNMSTLLKQDFQLLIKGRDGKVHTAGNTEMINGTYTTTTDRTTMMLGLSNEVTKEVKKSGKRADVSKTGRKKTPVNGKGSSKSNIENGAQEHVDNTGNVDNKTSVNVDHTDDTGRNGHR